MDSKGQMPFAAVAVTILLVSVLCGAVAADYGRASDNADSVRKDAEAVALAVDAVERHIDRGLGEAILSVSRDDTLGGMDERMDAFREDGREWLLKQFPIVEGGVRAEYVSHDLELRAESMADADGRGSGHRPAYLRAVGTVTVDMDTHSGHARKVLNISTDGSYALPFVAGQGSLFDSMVRDGGISLSQMVEYQLTGLAQYRVLNGFGGSPYIGGEGTFGLITADDVRDAYRNALDALSLICFRTGDGTLERCPGIDLCDRLIIDRGAVELDMSAFYAQSLFAYIDDVALGWFEYFCMDKVFDAMTNHLGSLLDVGRAIKDVLRGESVFGAQSYIRDAMGRAGYSEEDWRHPGSGYTTVTVRGTEFTVENPTADILQKDWITHFKSNRKFSSNFVLDGMRDILREAALQLAERNGMGKIAVHIDPGDERTFAEDLARAFEDARGKCRTSFGAILKDASERRDFDDPFCRDIANTISSRADSFCFPEELRSRIMAQLESSFPEYFDGKCRVPNCQWKAMGMECVDSGHCLNPGDLFDYGELDSCIADYERKVHSDLEMFDVLMHQPGDRNAIEALVSGIASYFLTIPSMLAPVEDSMDRMVREVCDAVRLNPHSGLTELPTEDCFRLVDKDGNVSGETVVLKGFDSDPRISVWYDSPGSIPVGKESGSTHNVGFASKLFNAYTTVVHVSIEDDITYTLDGSGKLADSMGKVTTRLTDTVHTGFGLEIPVISGWALEGISYRSSTNLLQDAASMLLEFLEPVLEPLRKSFAAMRAAITASVERLVEIGRYAAEAVEELYMTVMEPVLELAAYISEHIGKMLNDGTLRIVNSIARDLQRTTISYCGYDLTFKTDAGSWLDGTKYVVGVVLQGKVCGMDFEAGLDFKNKGEQVRSENIKVLCHGKLAGDGWSVSAKADPNMGLSNKILTVNGHTGENRISLTIPQVVSYHSVGISLGETAAGPMISNIPLPVPGLKAGFDAGFEIRYSEPEKKGLVINEFESNPAGPDNGAEWVEIMNNSVVPMSLDGYTLTASSDWKKKVMTLSGDLGPGEFTVVHPDFAMVNEKGKNTRNGEALTLKDPDGEVVDKTPTVRDTRDDAETWHRVKDGALDWTFGTPSPGASNGTRLSGVFSEAAFGDIALEAIDKSFDELPVIYTAEDCQEFLRILVKNVLDIVIDRITGSVIDASVFAKVEFSDLSGAASCSSTVSFKAYQGLAVDVLRYIAGQLQVLLLNSDNPYRIDPVGMFTENIGMEVYADTGIGLPDMFGRSSGMRLGVMFGTNMASLTHLFGKDTGRPELAFGIMSADCPAELIPGRMSVNPEMHHDFWLLKATVAWR